MGKIKLSDEERKTLDEAKDALDEAAEAIGKLRALGVDVAVMENRLDEARRIRDGLLENF